MAVQARHHFEGKEKKLDSSVAFFPFLRGKEDGSALEIVCQKQHMDATNSA
jgi:hypothetical protein